MEIFKKAGKLIDPKIKEVLSSSISKKNAKILLYQIELGGKKLRPALVLTSCSLCGKPPERAVYPAAAVEILHNCTLIYDDIIDKSPLRREKATMWTKFGSSISQCIGLDYSAAIFQSANKSDHPFQISETLAIATKIIMEGEILDILFEQSGRENEKYVLKNRYKKITEGDYLEMAKKKTASLMSASCEVGAISAQATEEKKEALKNYGLNLGIAFQITDDILDIFGKKKKFGKKIGNDIKEKKLGNIVILSALQELGPKDKIKVRKILKKDKLKDKDIKETITLIKKTSAKRRSSQMAEKYISKAKKYLDIFPKNQDRKILEEIADFILKREK